MGAIPIPIDKWFWVYMLASNPRGVLYVGMTSDLPGRISEHRDRIQSGVTTRYNVDRLVYFERHDEAADAARRERAMKRWRRQWKIALIEKHNPTWRDLFGDVLRDEGFEW